MKTPSKSVLFVCIHNAGRSQMAAGLTTLLGGGAVEVRSAGSAPANEINPAVVEVMAELGIDLAHELPKPLTDDAVQAADAVVTMGCGDACPIFPGKRYLDWQVDDPAGQPVEVVRRIRDDIRARVEILLADLGVSPRTWPSPYVASRRGRPALSRDWTSRAHDPHAMPGPRPGHLVLSSLPALRRIAQYRSMQTPTSEQESGFKALIRRVWHGGLVRRVMVTREGRTLVDVPLTVIVIGGVLAPWLLALGAVVAVLTGCQLAVRQPEPLAIEEPTVGDETASEGPVLD